MFLCIFTVHMSWILILNHKGSQCFVDWVMKGVMVYYYNSTIWLFRGSFCWFITVVPFPVLWRSWIRCFITWFYPRPSKSWPSLYVLCNLLSILRFKRTLTCKTQYSHSVVVYTLGLSHTVYCVEIIAGKGKNMQVLAQIVYHLGVFPKLVIAPLNCLCRKLSLQCCIFYSWPLLVHVPLSLYITI